jgi:hypothetical protein
VPGVQSASIADSTPYSLEGDHRSVRRAGTRPGPDVRPATAADGLAFNASFNAVGADYLVTVGRRLLRGRTFTRFETDHSGAPPVALVDEALATLLWPGEDALGRRVEWARSADATQAEKHRNRRHRAHGTHPGRNKEISRRHLHPVRARVHRPCLFLRPVRARGEAALIALREPIRRALQAAAADVPFSKVQTLLEHKHASLELWMMHRLSAVATAFGAAAALIAVIGLYGAKAYGVSRRTREIGIRLALGAEPSRLRNLILREGLASGLLGIVLGLLLGAALGRLLDHVIVELTAFDPIVFALAALAVFAAALVASWLPAKRATRVNPLEALRAE